MNKPELLSPAGSMQHLQFAFAYGADAVYIGQPRHSLRVRNNEFSDIDKVGEAIDYAHRLGKKIYMAVNISPHNNKVDSFLKYIEPVIKAQPDALIMSDPGLIMMVREHWPDMPVHLSVQANAVNWATVKFWQQQGLERVILSRELSLEEIADIQQKVPGMELEVFVHGALCIAYSGRCLLSGYMTHRDPNQGACTNSCRWKYSVHDAVETTEGNTEVKASAPLASEVVLLEEQGRPGEYMPAFEDEHGTYIMNSKDLRAVQHVKPLYDMGVHSLKIEGRTKSHFYVARTAQIYRRAIDNAAAGKEFDWDLMDQLQGLSNRGYTEGFYRRHPPEEYQNYDENNANTGTQQFVGQISGFDADQQCLSIEVKNKFAIADSVELMTPSGNHTFTVEQMTDSDDNPIEVAPGSGWQVKITVPPELAAQLSAEADLSYLLLIKNL